MISIIHPTRSRPTQSLATTTKWLALAGCDVELIVSIDLDDPDREKYYAAYSSRFAHVITNPNKSAIEAINIGAKYATGNILIVVSDDTDCPVNWGASILELTKGRTDWILNADDGIQKHRLITMPCMDRKYYERFGYIYFPGYEHMCADDEMTRVAEILGKQIKTNLEFPHRHYSVEGTMPDEVTKRADATLAQGRRLYKKRKKKFFFLK